MVLKVCVSKEASRLAVLFSFYSIILDKKAKTDRNDIIETIKCPVIDIRGCEFVAWTEMEEKNSKTNEKSRTTINPDSGWRIAVCAFVLSAESCKSRCSDCKSGSAFEHRLDKDQTFGRGSGIFLQLYDAKRRCSED